MIEGCDKYLKKFFIETSKYSKKKENLENKEII